MVHLPFTHSGHYKGHRSVATEFNWTDGVPGRIELYLQRHFVTWTGKPIGTLALAELSDIEIDDIFAEFFPAHKIAHKQPHRPQRPHTVVTDLSDVELVEKALRSDRDRSFRTAWYGEGSDKSNLQQSLLNKLAYWCGSDHARMRSVFKISPLYASFNEKQLERFERRFETEAAKACEWNPTAFRSTSTHETPRITEGYANSSDHVSRAKSRPLTDLGNAERLIDLHGRDLHWSEEFDSWLVWDGTCYRLDKTLRVVQLAKETVRKINDEAAGASARKSALQTRLAQLPSVGEGEPAEAENIRQQIKNVEKLSKDVYGWAKTSEGNGYIRSMISLARSEQDISILAEHLDADPCCSMLKTARLS